LRILRCIMLCDVSVWYMPFPLIPRIRFFIGRRGKSSFSVFSS
jgi:hypothetical protein